MEFFRWMLTLFALAVVGDAAAQSQACLRDRPWPASYSARTEQVGSGWIAEITLAPWINAYALGHAYLKQGKIIISVSIIDDCSGFGPQPPQAVTFTVEDLTAASYPIEVLVTGATGANINPYPTVQLPALAVGEPEPIPAASTLSLAMLGLAIIISIKRLI